MEECVVRKCWRLPEIPGNLALDSKNKSSLEYWWGRSSMNIVEERMNDRGGGLNMQMPLCHTWIVWSDAVPGFCLPAPRLAGNFVEIVARNKWIRGGNQRVVIQVGRYLGGSWVYQTSQPKILRKIISYGVLQGWSEAVRCGGWGSWDMEVGEVEIWRLEILENPADGGGRSVYTPLTSLPYSPKLGAQICNKSFFRPKQTIY